MSIHSLLRRLAALPTLGAMLLLAACSGGGGGADIAGVGSGGSGVVSGVVSGFGSLIVDGTEYDDSNATHQSQDASGTLVNAPVKLGQRVRLTYTGSNVVQTVEVQPQLLGPVSDIPAADGIFHVMGQTVRLVATNSNADQSAATVLAGYTSPADIRVGDDVEVHGSWVADAALASQVLVATRIEKISVPADPVLFSGVVAATGTGTLRLNSAGGTTLASGSLPAVSVGDTVRAWAPRSALTTSPVQVTRVAPFGMSAGDIGSGTGLVGGLASNYDAATRSLSVNGMRVRMADGVSADETALARGEFVVVQLAASGASVVVTGVRIRGAADLGRTTLISGVTRNIDWSQPKVSFMLRGTLIQAPASSIADACRTFTPANNVAIEVSGVLATTANLLTASSVRCSLPPNTGMTADYEGTIRSINLQNQTLVLMPDGASVPVGAAWDSRTYFSQRPDSLPVGLRVGVEGVMDKGSDMLRLTRVIPAQ